MSDVEILQTDRGMGKTTYMVETVQALLAQHVPVAVIVATEMQARHLHHLFDYHGLESRPGRRSPLRVLTLINADIGLRGAPRGTRIIAEDVDTWEDGIYHPVLRGPHAVTLITSSFDAEPTLAMIRRVTRAQREWEARRQAEYRRQMKRAREAYARAWMLFYIQTGERPHA